MINKLISEVSAMNGSSLCVKMFTYMWSFPHHSLKVFTCQGSQTDWFNLWREQIIYESPVFPSGRTAWSAGSPDPGTSQDCWEIPVHLWDYAPIRCLNTHRVLASLLKSVEYTAQQHNAFLNGEHAFNSFYFCLHLFTLQSIRFNFIVQSTMKYSKQWKNAWTCMLIYLFLV